MFVLIWLTLGGYLLSAIVVIEALLILYLAKKEKKYDFLSYFVAIPLAYLRQKRTWSLTFARLMEHSVMLAIIWLSVFFDFHCKQIFECPSHDKIQSRLWLNKDSFGFILLIATTIMTFLTPFLYFIIWKYLMLRDISRLMATQERDIWIIVKTGDLRGLTEMIEFGVNPDLRNGQNETLLHVYFRSYIAYNQEFVNVLSEHSKFYMGAKSAPGRQTILHSAMSHSMPSKEAIKYLLSLHRHILSLNDTDCDGKNAFMYYLNPCNTKLHFMRDANSKLLKLMANEKYGMHAIARDNNGNCIVHYACKNPMISDNNIEFVIDLYLDAVRKMHEQQQQNEGNDNENMDTEDVNVKIKLTDKEHLENYHKNRPNVVANNQWEYLLDCIDVKNRFHETPIMYYLRYNSMISNSMIFLFIQHGMDPFNRDGFKNSVFHWAVANPSINRQFGCDALKFMCQHMEKCGSLMDAFECNAKKESIFHCYFLQNTQFHEDIVRLLLDYRVDINTLDLKGNTCLHYAMANKSVNERFLLFLMAEDGGDILMSARK